MSRARFFAIYVVMALASGCAASPASAPAKSANATPGVAQSKSAASPAAPADAIRQRPEWREHFVAEHVAGTIALFDSADGSLSCSDVVLCRRPTIPASTFKIANCMIALETGVVQDAETKLPWDGKNYSVPEWNQNNTLRTAVQFSCVPCFQAMARNVGEQRMAEWLNKLDYGNQDMSGGVDRFWLMGGLRISPLQQIDFLRRFDGRKLPISVRTSETVRDLITLDVGQGYTLLGKTGSALPPEEPEFAMWFVGWLELGERKVFFATLINKHDEGVDPKPTRRRVTERVLRALNLLPEDATRAPTDR
jgi:beta-lactamase class D